MPPLWLTVGVLIITGLTTAIDHVILKPRGSTLIIEGKPVPVRRKREVQLLMALMSTGLIIFVDFGFALIDESDIVFMLILTIPFAGIPVWSLWRALREEDRLPTEKEVSAAISVSKAINKHALLAFGAIGVQMALGALISATHGVVLLILVALNFALVPVEVVLLWRFLRAIREMQSNAASI